MVPAGEGERGGRVSSPLRLKSCSDLAHSSAASAALLRRRLGVYPECSLLQCPPASLGAEHSPPISRPGEPEGHLCPPAQPPPPRRLSHPSQPCDPGPMAGPLQGRRAGMPAPCQPQHHGGLRTEGPPGCPRYLWAPGLPVALASLPSSRNLQPPPGTLCQTSSGSPFSTGPSPWVSLSGVGGSWSRQSDKVREGMYP